MPIYEYRCMNCNDVVEEIVKVGENTIKCEKCGETRKRVMSRFSGVVKGSTNRLLDCVVGQKSEERWKMIHERKEARDKIRKNIKEKKNVG